MTGNKKAREVLSEITATKPGTSAKDFVDRLASRFGMTGEELFNEMKARRKKRG